jgi:hypothetical protein
MGYANVTEVGVDVAAGFGGCVAVGMFVGTFVGVMAGAVVRVGVAVAAG